MHGIVEGLHHVEWYEDDEEVVVTVFLGINHDFRGGAVPGLGSSAGRVFGRLSPSAEIRERRDRESARTVNGLRDEVDGLRSFARMSLPMESDIGRAVAPPPHGVGSNRIWSPSVARRGADNDDLIGFGTNGPHARMPPHPFEVW
jgi:hypothetical protein